MQDWKDLPPPTPRTKRPTVSKIESVLGVTGSARPCALTTCGGLMYAKMHNYSDGTFRLIFTCNRCKLESEFGVTDAKTREPQNEEEALA